MKIEWKKTKYTGVRYREHPTRKNGSEQRINAFDRFRQTTDKKYLATYLSKDGIYHCLEYIRAAEKEEETPIGMFF